MTKRVVVGLSGASGAACEAGAVLLPPIPAFYIKPATVAVIIDQIARRAIDLTKAFAPKAEKYPLSPPSP